LNEPYEKIVSVDTVEKFKRKMSEFLYKDYGSGCHTDSSIRNASKLLLCYAQADPDIRLGGLGRYI